jgi:CubicO group peptidase (beta-lactamase class C family)
VVRQRWVPRAKLHPSNPTRTEALEFERSTLEHDTVAYKTFTGSSFSATAANTRAWRAADLDAANGHGNAQSVAEILAPIARAGASARGQLLKPDTIGLIFDEQSSGTDLVNGLYLRWGIGYALPDRRTLSWIPDGRIAFWGGWGGSTAIMDLDRRMTISYVMNNMGADVLGSQRAAAYTTALYRALGSRAPA